MRLLHVVPSYLPATRYGGPIYSVHGLCKALVNRGHDVHVVTTNVDGAGDTDVPLETPVDFDAVKIWYFPSHRLRRIFWSPVMSHELSRIVQKFDILHLHSIFLWPTSMAAHAARKFKVPYIISPRGMLVKDLIQKKSRLAKSLWIRMVEKTNLEQAAAIHCTSDIEAAECRAFNFELPHLTVIPNGIEYKKFDVERDAIPAMGPGAGVLRTIERQPLILFLGRINWKKGLDRLVPALSEVPSAHLAIAGNDNDGYTQKVQAIAKQSGVAGRISFLGPVQEHDKAVLYKNAKLFVLPSYSENFGNTVLEAMAHACPVVVTPEVGIAGAVIEANAGIVTQGKPQAIAKTINRILSNDELRKSMGQAGAKLVQEKYRWESVAQQMEAEYQTLAKSQPLVKGML